MSAWEILAEDFFGKLGMAGRPADDSGVRKGLYRPPIKRAGNYPYDKTDPDNSYGTPQAYDRGSNVGSAGHSPITPRDISDADAERMGLKKDPFKKEKLEKLSDEELDEVLGSPMLLSRGNTSSLGSSVPGSAGSWSKNPPKDWDDEDLSKLDDAKVLRLIQKLHIRRPDLTRESPLQIDTRAPDIEEIPNQEPEYHVDQSDSDLERRLFVLGLDKSDGYGNAPDGYSPGINGNRLTSRGLYGLMPKESAWESLNSILRSR